MKWYILNSELAPIAESSFDEDAAETFHRLHEYMDGHVHVATTYPIGRAVSAQVAPNRDCLMVPGCAHNERD